jgi:hypothetical protein
LDDAILFEPVDTIANATWREPNSFPDAGERFTGVLLQYADDSGVGEVQSVNTIVAAHQSPPVIGQICDFMLRSTLFENVARW